MALPGQTNPFSFGNQNIINGIQAGAGLAGTLGQMVAPDVYDARLQATKPGLGQFADLKLTAAGSMFGPVGTGIGLAADITKNALAYKNQMNQYNQALSKNKFINSSMPMLPDYTQFMANGGMTEQMGMPVLQNNEIVLMPQPDGSWKKVMQTSPNAPTHAEGGVPAPNLPAGAVVFPGQYVQQIEQALQSGDFQSISQMAQQVLQESQQAKQQGQPYSSGGGGQLPPEQQMQAQQQMPADMMQQQPTEQMPFQGMRCGGMVKHYGNGGMVLPDMMQSDDYATQKARMEEEARMANMSGNAVNVTALPAPNNVVNQNPNAGLNLPAPVNANVDLTTDNSTADVQNYIQNQTGYDKKGNYVNYQNDLDYYSPEFKAGRNAEWERKGKPNPDAVDNGGMNNTTTNTNKTAEKSSTSNNTNPTATTSQNRDVSRQQAKKAGVYEKTYWDDEKQQRMIVENGKREVFDPKKYDKSTMAEIGVLEKKQPFNPADPMGKPFIKSDSQNKMNEILEILDKKYPEKNVKEKYKNTTYEEWMNSASEAEKKFYSKSKIENALNKKKPETNNSSKVVDRDRAYYEGEMVKDSERQSKENKNTLLDAKGMPYMKSEGGVYNKEEKGVKDYAKGVNSGEKILSDKEKKEAIVLMQNLLNSDKRESFGGSFNETPNTADISITKDGRHVIYKGKTYKYSDLLSSYEMSQKEKSQRTETAKTLLKKLLK